MAGAGREEMVKAAAANCKRPGARGDQARANGSLPPITSRAGWALVALQNAFYRLRAARASRKSLVATVGCGGDTDTNAAIAGALLGALHGRAAIPVALDLPVLACRPLAEAAEPRPRPMVYWPDDVLELAEALLG